MGNQNNKDKEDIIEDYSEWNLNLNKIYSNYNDIANLTLKTKIYKEELEFFGIFPNGNILLYKKNEIKILEAETYKTLFNYNKKNIDYIIILSNNDLLIIIKDNINALVILNFEKPNKILEKKIKIKYTYNKGYLDKSSIGIAKLKNNRILFFYEYDYDRNEDVRGYCFIFYKYNKIKSTLKFEYEKTHYLEHLNIIIPYEITNSFISFGDYEHYLYSNPDAIHKHSIDLYIDKKFINILDITDEFDKDLHGDICDCFSFKKKYIIVILLNCIRKYEIKEDDTNLICEKKFSKDRYVQYLLKDESSFYLIYRKNDETKDDYIFVEFDENIDVIKEENLTVNNFRNLFVYDKHIYIMSQNEIRIYA